MNKSNNTVVASDKLKRLIDLADKVFSVKNDPNQLNVTQGVIKRLHRIHPSTVCEYRAEDGPVAWVIVIPTTNELMRQFLNKEINERELFERTPLDSEYDAVYLCSALVLDEYRRKGITKDLTVKAINDIRKEHPITGLFVWPFSKEGDKASEKIADELKLPLYRRTK
jgi:hypothetical protein